jgi:hypothetical protein
MSTLSILRKIKKLVLVSLGLLFLGLGIIGYVLPGLPGTIWLIISATFFVRSSERLYRFVTRNRIFGSQIKNFLDTGAMPRRAKVMAVSFMWLFSMISVLFAPYGWLFDLLIIALAVAGTIYVLSRPHRTSTK